MITQEMIRQFAVAFLAAGLVAGTAAADVVHLVNGESFEDVIAKREGEHVVIRLEFGELALPAKSVARIDSSVSALGGFLDQREALLDSGSAAAWVELAHWARARGLDHGYRESIFLAADLDPHLEELEADMRRLGYVLDEELDRWIPFADHMRRAGLILYDGAWIRPDQRPSMPPRAPASEGSEVDAVLSRTVELLARAQLERELRETEEVRQATQRQARGSRIPYGFPVAHFGGFFFAPVVPGTVDEPTEADPPTAGIEPLPRRPPGSLLPAGGSHRGSIRQPGSLLPASARRR